MQVYEEVAIVSIFSSLLLLLFWYFRSRKIKEENDYLARQHRLMEIHYEVLQNQVERVRKIRHDIKNHIQTLEYFLEKPEYDSSVYRQYKQDIEKMNQDYIIREWTDNDVVNVALYNKIKQCEEEGIQIHSRIELPDIRGFDEIEIVTVLYNLFDNVLEACRCLSEERCKFLNLEIWQDQQGIWFDFLNPRNEDYKPLKGEKTVKQDKQNHGLGKMILKEIAERNQGSVQFITKRERFRVKLFLRRKEC